MELDSENVVQAVVIMDTFNNYFTPITNNTPLGLLLVAGVPLINFILESLALGGVGETILFCCQDGPQIKEHIRQCQEEKVLWSVSMDVQVMISDTCQTMGDVMREIDTAGLIRGDFVLAGINSITNIPYAALMELHKQTCKHDKGAAMTLVYKKVSWEHPLISSDQPTLLAADARTNKVLLLHKKYNPTKSAEKSVRLPLEMILNGSKVKFHHNLADANIALCSPAVPRLFSDNVDFQTRDDIIHGILRNEELLASSLYYLLLKENQNAADVTNWKTEQFRSFPLAEHVVIGANTVINDNRIISDSVIGNNCVFGNYVTITGSHLMNNIVVNDNTKIINSFIGNDCVINANCVLEGVTLGANVVVGAGSHLKGSVRKSTDADKERTLLESTLESTKCGNESPSSQVKIDSCIN